jgi:hypothetical protein
MKKPISSMTPEELAELMGDEKTAEQRYQEDYGNEEEIDVPLQDPAWHAAHKPRDQFLSSLDRKPKKGVMSMLSKDDPNELAKYPKGTKIKSNTGDPVIDNMLDNYHPPQPEREEDEVLMGKTPKPKRDYGFLGDAVRIVMWCLHTLMLAAVLYFTYYMITLVKSPGAIDLALISTLAIIISIELSLLSVNVVLGTVIRRN